MRTFSLRASWRTGALVLANLLLVTGIGQRLWEGTGVEGVLHTPATVMKVPALHTDLPPLSRDFRGLVDRTPFYASRRLYVSAAPSATPPPPVPKYVFGGAVIHRPGPAVALLNGPNGAAVRVTTGVDIEGWRVESIEATRVVLRHENEQAEIARVTKNKDQAGGAVGISRVHVAGGGHLDSGGGVRVLGSSGHAVNHEIPAAVNLPPLAGSGSGSVFIPAPPH